MPPRDNNIDMELLRRLASGLEESSRGLKSFQTLQNQQQQLWAEYSSLSTVVSTLEKRIQRLEQTVEGGGGQEHGIKTKVAIIHRDVLDVQKSLGAIAAWREGLGERKIQQLQGDRRDSQNARSGMILGIIASLIAMGSLLSTCGPQLYKAWKPDVEVRSPAQ